MEDLTKDIIDGITMKEKSDLWWTDYHINNELNLKLYSFTTNWAKVPTEDEIKKL